MAAIDEIYRYLNEIAPFSTAMDFDNAGFLVGDGKTEVTKARRNRYARHGRKGRS